VRCSVREPLRKVHERIISVLEGMTIAEIAAETPVSLTVLR